MIKTPQPRSTMTKRDPLIFQHTFRAVFCDLQLKSLMGKQGMKQSTFAARDFSIESMNFSLEQTGEWRRDFPGHGSEKC